MIILTTDSDQPVLSMKGGIVPSLDFERITKRYTTTNAVDNLNLKIYPGELFGFLGPNGAGKTTAMKLASGLIQPTMGRIRIVGFDVQAEPLKAKRLTGYVPDSPYIYESLTGREFMHYCAGLYRISSSVAEAKIVKLFEQFAIGSWGDKRAGEYSHGMKQRVVMASAFLHEPKVILIDEPMVGLDPAGVKLAKKVLRDYCDSGGAVFLSTHTLSNAEELSDRIAIINRGKLMVTGALEEIKRGDEKLEDAYLAITNPELKL